MRRTCRILVALDGTAASESALGEVERISAGGASVHFLYVVPLLPIHVAATPAAVMADHDRAMTYLGGLRERLPDLRGIDVVRTGEPAEAILQVAREFQVDLLAMGTRVRRDAAQGALGSAADGVLRQTSLPVLLKRPGSPSARPLLRRILLPLDDSEEARSILPAAVDIALRTGAELVFLHLSEGAQGRSPPGGSVDPKAKLLELAARLERTDVAFWQTMAEGDAVETILAQAEALDADVIAMTGPAAGDRAPALIGKSAPAVLGRTDRAVLWQGQPDQKTARHFS